MAFYSVTVKEVILSTYCIEAPTAGEARHRYHSEGPPAAHHTEDSNTLDYEITAVEPSLYKEKVK